MKRASLFWLAGLATVLALAFASVATADELLARDQADVTVHNVVVKDGTVTGVITNNSDLLVRNTRVLVRHAWLWADEYEPGENNPGRSEIVMISEQIPAGESLTFTSDFPTPPVDATRGRFETSGQVVEFEQVGRSSVSSLR